MTQFCLFHKLLFIHWFQVFHGYSNECLYNGTHSPRHQSVINLVTKHNDPVAIDVIVLSVARGCWIKQI